MLFRKIGSKIKVSFSCDELEMTQQLFNYVLSQIDNKSAAAKLKLPKDTFEELYIFFDKLFKQHDKNTKMIEVDFDEKKLKSFYSAFRFAADYTEEWEFPIVTGYQWANATSIMQDMQHSLSLPEIEQT